MRDQTLIIANLKYVNPQRIGRGHGAKGLRAKLKYLQYRDDRDTHILQHSRERWVDHGLGSNYGEIQAACQDLQSDQVLAWTWVISPEPDLMQHIPVDVRPVFIEELTEAIVERYYDARGVEPDYSYVVHQATATDGRPHPHSHVILPGTAWTHADGWIAVANYRDAGHLQLLDDIAHDELTQALEQQLGQDWQQTVGLAPTIPADIEDLDAWFPR